MASNKQSLILIVDDNPTNLKVLFGFLKECGFKVLVAKSGESAIAQAQETLPDVILLDVMMTGINGFETCRRLKALSKTKDIPIIFMTALADPVDKVKGLTLGAVDYITKPFQQEEVLARINIHLRLQQEIKERTAAEIALKNLTAELEKRVEERTAELFQSLKQVQQTQVQMVQSEKMSSLGELVAGVAHEINNPVGFITNNIMLAKESVEDLISHLQLYRETFANPGTNIEKNAEEIDLDYLIEDLPKMLASMQVGAERIRNLSVSLRSFSRGDRVSKTAVNIHECIDSTLMILQHRLKASNLRPAIEVVKNYGDLPLVECYAGSLNQVFMNLLANAIDAVEESNERRQISFAELSLEPNRIRITTSAINFGGVAIRIADNGAGISEQVKDEMFEPFVTTKPVGKGTGLGLSICHNIIVEKHGGALECNSKPGEGTEFIIKIPQGEDDSWNCQQMYQETKPTYAG